MENYKFKKYKEKFKTIYKTGYNIKFDGNITFDDNKIEEYKFHKNKPYFISPISKKDIDINEIVVSNNLPL